MGKKTVLVPRATMGSLALVSAFTALSIGAHAEAQTPAINFGQGIDIRMENSTNYDSGSPVGQTKLSVNVLLDTYTEGPFVLTLEQSHRVLATGSCTAEPTVLSGEVLPGAGYLRECQTAYIPAANLRTTEPADVVIAMVDDATDARTELYRGTFPVIAFNDWKGNDGDRPTHVEQRALRLDSFYGVGFIHQTHLGNDVSFTYVDAQNDGEIPNESAMRCKVGTGEWRAYTTSVWEGTPQVARNRVWADNAVHEDGPETIVTQFIRFSTSMPIAVNGGGVTPEAGSSMDGAWTCEIRFGGSGQRVVAREFRFEVRNGLIQANAIEAQVAPGRGTAFASVGMNPDQMPAIFDPALVRDNVAGRHLTGATAPLVSAMPARATNPSFTMPRAAAAASGRGGGRRR